MARLPKQTKAAALPPSDSLENVRQIMMLAQAGKFTGKPAYELMCEVDRELDDPSSPDWLTLTDSERRAILEGINEQRMRRIGQIYERIYKRDAAFFREMAECLERFSAPHPDHPDATHPPIDEVLKALAAYRLNNYLNNEVLTATLEDYLRTVYGIAPDPAEIRRKARMVGLKIRYARGRPIGS